MKRTAIILALIAPILLVNLPAANATVYAERCYNFYGPGGNRAVQFCVSLGSDGTDWWGRAESHDIAGYGSIYTAAATLKYFSKNSNGVICWGDVSAGAQSCGGQGTNTLGNFQPPSNGATQPHFGWTDHYCTSWANLDVTFYYIQGGTRQDTGDLNSWAVTTPPCAS
jgi:hypothetical protein